MNEKCTAQVWCDHGVVKSESCKTKQPCECFDSNYDDTKEEWMCNDCGHTFTVYWDE